VLPVSEISFSEIGRDIIDFSLAGDGAIWAISNKRIGGGGNEIFCYKEGIWNLIDGEALKISVDRYGEPWVVNEIGRIW
jgi:hypothetical protein